MATRKKLPMLHMTQVAPKNDSDPGTVIYLDQRSPTSIGSIHLSVFNHKISNPTSQHSTPFFLPSTPLTVPIHTEHCFVRLAGL